MERKVKKKFWGTIFVILGLIILLTPFTPGSVLLLIGADMLFGHRVKWWNNLKKKLKKHFGGFLKD
jgi:hypothetical protein